MREFRETDETEEEENPFRFREMTPEERDAILGEIESSKLNIEMVHKMYFDEDWTQLEIAKHFGYKSSRPIRRIFKEQGWKKRARKLSIEKTHSSNIETNNLLKSWMFEMLHTIVPRNSVASCIYSIDMKNDLKLNKREIRSLERHFQQVQESLNGCKETRYGIVDGNLYAWKPDLNPLRLENAYSEMYYYFRNHAAYDKYLLDVGNALNLETKNKLGVNRFIRKLVSQLSLEPSDYYCINPQTKRIRGDHIHLLNDISGKTLVDIQRNISLITGKNGQGGIKNPRFPQDEQLEIIISRIAATALSDCHLAPNGLLKLGESELDRMKKVEENLRKLGDIKLSIKHVENENLYVTYFPFIIGKLLMQRGLPSGDRSIQNPRLIKSIRTGSDKVKRVYIEDFVPQDGSTDGKILIWQRANVLHAGRKTESYGFKSDVRISEISLIKEYGTRNKGEVRSITLTLRKLDELSNQSDIITAQHANRLISIVKKNPNRLMEDEAELIRSWSIDVKIEPLVIRYYPITGRVSVTWQAWTAGISNTFELFAIAPPNDIKNRQKILSMITSNPEKINEAITSLRKKGIEFEMWWKRAE